MARTALTIKTIKGPYPGTVAADALDVAFEASTGLGGNSGNDFVCTGQEILMVFNSHATTAYTFTLTSQIDPYKRSGDVTAYSLAAGEYAAFAFTNVLGWITGGKMQLEANNAAIKFLVLKIV